MAVIPSCWLAAGGWSLRNLSLALASLLSYDGYTRIENMTEQLAGSTNTVQCFDKDTKMRDITNLNENEYDTNLVAPVIRNDEYLNLWRKVSLLEASTMKKTSQQTPSPRPSLVPCDGSSSSLPSSRFVDEVLGGKSTIVDTCENKFGVESSTSVIEQQDEQPPVLTLAIKNTKNSNKIPPCCYNCLPLIELNQYIHGKKNDDEKPSLPPLGGTLSESVIYIPSSRNEWEDSIDEMVAVCSASAWRRYQAKHNRTRRSKSSKNSNIPPFNPPIQRIYIKERIDIDDPLQGFQIRHRSGGWLQGFVMITTFTTWTHYFKWDFYDPRNGIANEKNVNFKVDEDGSLTAELEEQPRSGDPLGGGNVWPTVAEISLVGALGCGEYLVQLALDAIARKGVYDYVVLESTADARAFYEKFGFVRVGAVSKYGSEQDFATSGKSPEVVGYRHWTYANETTQRLDKHGAPSCMMARRITPCRSMSEETVPSCLLACNECHKKISKPSFLDQLSSYIVEEKPKIEPLGSISLKRKRPNQTQHEGSLTPSPSNEQHSNNDRPRKRITTASGRHSNGPNRLDIATITPQRRKNRRTMNTSNTTAPNSNKKSRQYHTKQLSLIKPASLKAPTVSATTGILTKQQSLRKQKIINMKRDPKKTYYYNKVVTPKQQKYDSSVYKSKYYFVLDFQEVSNMIRIIPIYKIGTFKGKREGRPKWKANVLSRNLEEPETKYFQDMDVITCPCSLWDVVPSFNVTKCSSVAEESWDILI